MTASGRTGAEPIAKAVEGLRAWVVGEALPLWAGAGFDAARGAFHERLDFRGQPIADAPRRTMAQARQIYVYAHASGLGWYPQSRDLALAAARNLIARHFEADGAPGWVFSIAPDGEVADARRDFYAHAFVLFGLAWAYRLSPEPAFREVAEATLAVLDRDFASPTGGFFSSLPGDPTRRDQNPHMHLFEAMLAWHETTGEAAFLARAEKLYDLMGARLYQPKTGVLPEYYDGEWAPLPDVRGRICEPGHQYEWSWLLRAYAARIGRTDEPISAGLKAFADRHGTDAEGLIVDELTDDGAVHKASRRCWPHTEAIKAEVAAHEAGDASAGARAALWIARLRETFLGRPAPGGWIDHVDASGAPIVGFMPASTLYHVFLATAEAHRVWGRTG